MAKPEPRTTRSSRRAALVALAVAGLAAPAALAGPVALPQPLSALLVGGAYVDLGPVRLSGFAIQSSSGQPAPNPSAITVRGATNGEAGRLTLAAATPDVFRAAGAGGDTYFALSFTVAGTQPKAPVGRVDTALVATATGNADVDARASVSTGEPGSPGLAEPVSSVDGVFGQFPTDAAQFDWAAPAAVRARLWLTSDATGASVSVSSFAMTFTAQNRPGDANLDGAINFDDLVRLAQHYNTASGNRWADGDFNGDGAVDFSDLVPIAQGYNTAVGPFAADIPAAAPAAPPVASAVPEPAVGLALATLSGLGGLGRRRRRRPAAGAVRP